MNNSYLLNQEDYGIARICMYLGLFGFLFLSLVCAMGLGRGESAAVPVTLFVLAVDARFLVEWSRFRKSRQADLFEDRLSLYDDNFDVQKIPLECIRDVGSCSAIFVVRRFFGSLSRGTAFIKITLTDGSVLYTLAEQAAFEFPPGKTGRLHLFVMIFCFGLGRVFAGGTCEQRQKVVHSSFLVRSCRGTWWNTFRSSKTREAAALSMT